MTVEVLLQCITAVWFFSK